MQLSKESQNAISDYFNLGRTEIEPGFHPVKLWAKILGVGSEHARHKLEQMRHDGKAEMREFRDGGKRGHYYRLINPPKEIQDILDTIKE